MSTNGSNAPVAVIDGVPRLIGARCDACGTHVFPRQAGCSRCGAQMSEVALPTSGTVWSWTVQRIEPKPPYKGPAEFEPFAVAYVHLDSLRVESPLAGRPVDEWQIGETVHLVADDIDDEGHAWRFHFEGGER
ncbi:MAG TPA: OB-fold domain-containing protein [Acidimicrobiales bacterium]|nr:OB-fold domain-containing protein [Acidimicrobiales bacterium]